MQMPEVSFFFYLDYAKYLNVVICMFIIQIMSAFIFFLDISYFTYGHIAYLYFSFSMYYYVVTQFENATDPRVHTVYAKSI